MERLAWRNISQNKARLTVSVGGVALALTLILALDAVFTGAGRQLTAYIDHAGAQVFVSQRGVRNMHMSSSWVPAATLNEVAAVPGVASVTPVMYVTSTLTAGEDRSLAYIIGVPDDARSGGPWRITEGSALPGPGQAVIDRVIAERAGIGLSDQVRTLGGDFTVVGLADGTISVTNSIAWISTADFTRLRGDPGTPPFSFGLVTTNPDVSPDEVARRITAAVPSVTVQTRAAFARQERTFVTDMSTEVIAIMNLAGFLVGLAVLALTVYIATLARRAEWGLLKALGARNSQLYRAVAAQAGISVVLGLALALAITLLLSLVVPRVTPAVTLALSGSSLVKVGGVALTIGLLAAFLPAWQLGRLDPAIVYRRGGPR
jgi:putative ABC transport system permease protein